MNDSKLYQLFESTKLNGELGFAALGKTVFATTSLVDILELARFMAARHNYPDAHADLDKWIDKLEDEKNMKGVVEDPLIDSAIGLLNVGIDNEELQDDPAIDKFVSLLGEWQKGKEQEIRETLRRLPIQEIYKANKAIGLIREEAEHQNEAQIYLHEWTEDLNKTTQEDYDLDHIDYEFYYEDHREAWDGERDD